jgi:hypothetical protein
MDTVAATTVHYLLVFLNFIGAESVIQYIGKHYRNPQLVNECLLSESNFANACSEFTLFGYVIIILLLTAIIGKGFFFFSSSSN